MQGFKRLRVVNDSCAQACNNPGHLEQALKVAAKDLKEGRAGMIDLDEVSSRKHILIVSKGQHDTNLFVICGLCRATAHTCLTQANKTLTDAQLILSNHPPLQHPTGDRVRQQGQEGEQQAQPRDHLLHAAMLRRPAETSSCHTV